MKLRTAPGYRGEHSIAAFTLIEAVIATALFFMAIFAILDLVTQGVRMAHALNQMGPTAGMVAAELSMTNKLEEGSFDGDFGELYQNYHWVEDISLYGTNGLFQVDITVVKDDHEDSKLSILLYRPESQSGGSDAGKRIFSGTGGAAAQRGVDSKRTFSGSGSGGGRNNQRQGGGGQGGRNSGFGGSRGGGFGGGRQ